MRVFVRLREMLATHKEPARKLAELEEHLESHDQQIQTIFEAIRQLMTPPATRRKRIYPVEFELAPSLQKDCANQMAI